MIYILLSLIVLLIFSIVCLIANNNKIKTQHTKNIQRLHEIITSLHDKQLQLNDKVQIVTAYNSNYSKDIKVIGNEVVELQRVFLEIIANRK